MNKKWWESFLEELAPKLAQWVAALLHRWLSSGKEKE